MQRSKDIPRPGSLALLALTAALACGNDRALEHQKALRQEIEAASKAAEAEGAAWREAMATFAQGGLPSTSDAPCEARPTDVEILRGRVWQALRPDALASAQSGRTAMRLDALKRLGQELSNTHLRNLEDPAPFREKVAHAASVTDGEVDVLVLIDAMTDPEVTSQSGAFGSFKPGTLKGRVLVWSYAEGRIVCAAEVDATNSETVHAGKYDSLLNDLHRSAMLQGLERAHKTAG